MKFVLNLLLFIPRFFEKAQAKSDLLKLKTLPYSKIHQSFRVGKNNYWDISSSAKLFIDENVMINESNYITLKKSAELKIGRATYITRATISCIERVEIGDNCILGEGLKIFDHNHNYTAQPFVVSKTEFNTAPVKIGNNVWTGANCIILKGVTIGNNVILGAGCIIYKDVPDNSIIINKQEQIIKDLEQ